MSRIRHVIVVLGDQLSCEAAAFDGFDAALDLVWMAEAAGESTYVLSHKVRIAYFLSAMRHFAEELRARDYCLSYRKLDDRNNRGELSSELRAALARYKPERVVVTEPGEYRMEQMLQAVCQEAGCPLEIRPDRHFYCSRQDFHKWAETHSQLRLEFFYRDLRKKTGVLMEHGQPVGGRWNFDSDNRKSFGKTGPGRIPLVRDFPPDQITREVIALVEEKFPHHPGSLEHFALPVTALAAQVALQDFVAHRLAAFGSYQDAMWGGQPFLYHSRISAAMNVKLLDPRVVIMAVEDAYHRGNAPLAAVEGFIRQILGWREYVRGVYWLHMPDYLERNFFHAAEKLPDLYWDAKTDMHCLQQVVGATLAFGYAHHIQRLMVTGLFALLFGVDPVEVHKWYLAIYWDAVEWVELPNTAGMSQFADGGLMASKPYIASGKYIQRMSNYCQQCRYRPEESTGQSACPFTTLYWDFLLRHESKLQDNQRLRMQLRNLERLSAEKKEAIQVRARELRTNLPKGNY